MRSIVAREYQPSPSDTIRRMSWTIHFKDAANLEVCGMAGLDFDYATGEDVDGGTPPRYAELMRLAGRSGRFPPRRSAPTRQPKSAPRRARAAAMRTF